MSARSSLAALALLAAAGCDFGAFDTYRANTPVVAYVRPPTYPNLLFAQEAAVLAHAERGDWLALSGGLGTATLALPVFGRDGFVRKPTPVYVCRDGQPCGGTSLSGTALAGSASWNGAPLCLLTGSFGTAHRVVVRCLGTDPPRDFTVDPPPGLEMSGFGLALATPRARGDDAAQGEIAFVGAPAGPGRVYALRPGALVDAMPGTTVTAGAQLGDALAVGGGRAGAGAGSDLVLAAGAPGARAAYVLRGEPRAARAMQWVACVTRPEEPGFGGAVAVGDFDGDGLDDLAVGARVDAAGRRARVSVFLAAEIPASRACDVAAWRAAAVHECDDAPASDGSPAVRCAGGAEGFGSSLAVGDLDADGRDELIVGAPGARVGDRDRAGAVWVLSARGRGADFTLVTAAVLRDQVPDPDAMLGHRVLGARLGGRDEVIALAPGNVEVLTFLCTGLEGDRPYAPGLDGTCRPR